MYALIPLELRRSTLACASDPASFDAEATAEGHRSVSCNAPTTLHPKPSRRDLGTLLAHARTSRNPLLWRGFRSSEHLDEVRPAIIGRFLANLPSWSPEHSYWTDELPHLTF